MAARTPKTGALPAAALPALRLVAELPDVVVVAVPTRPGDDGNPTTPDEDRTGPTRSGGDGGGPVLLGSAPVDLDVEGLLSREGAKGEAGEIVSVPVPGSGLLERVLLLGTGDGGPGALRRAGAAAARRAKGSASLAVDLRGLALDGAGLRALVEGLLLASYGFTVKDGAPRALTEVVLVGPTALQSDLEAAVIVATASAAARDLVNTPSLTKTPAWLALQATGLLHDLSVTVRDDKTLRDEGWGGVTAVGMGSSRPPRVVEVTWDGTGGRRARHIVLVGKGITFDTGGLSLKPNDGMLTMKMDMGGAAAVLATVRAAADLRLPIRVTALAAVAENMPSGAAQRPGDVITQYGGTTVEVLNTDAEGRLVLADAIAYADTVLKADVIVDIATLTGAMPVALGKRIAGLFATDDALAAGLLAAGESSGELLWRMPLVEDYRQALESTTADLRNIGDPKLKLSGGSITAALFLREFAGGRPFAHLDIAGPAWSGADDDELTKGGTGYGVRLLVRWLQDLAPVDGRPTAPAQVR